MKVSAASCANLCENTALLFICVEMYGLVMHYSTSGDAVACGRTGNNLSLTADADKVDCKSCQRSLVKAEAVPAKKATPSLAELRKQRLASQAPQASQVQATTFCFKANWRVRLAAQPDRCRLPRGVAPQAFV
ncbi:hypothetical protein D3C76_1202550 [compost metagenome]|jgi:hypothetical protein